VQQKPAIDRLSAVQAPRGVAGGDDVQKKRRRPHLDRRKSREGRDSL
jgi:hypothetical protein